MRFASIHFTRALAGVLIGTAGFFQLAAQTNPPPPVAPTYEFRTAHDPDGLGNS